MALARPAGTREYADLLDLPDDETRYEIIEGDLYELPVPLFAHVAAVIALLDFLLPPVQRLGGRRYTAPVTVFFDGADPVDPDIVVLLPGSRARPVRRGIEGPPDLLIEVLSPSNRAHHTVRKRALYARGGVREYWIVDPEAGSIEIIGADGETVQRVMTGDGDAILTLRSPLLGDVTADPGELFPSFAED